MRRLVGIPSKIKKSVMALMALAISLTSPHMAAAARTASLRRQQERLEHTAAETVARSGGRNKIFTTETRRHGESESKKKALIEGIHILV